MTPGRIRRLAFLLTVVFSPASLATEGAPSGIRDIAAQPQLKFDANAYPSLSERDLGHLRWALARASQALNDFENFDQGDYRGDSGWENSSAYRYQIAFAFMHLAAIQYHDLPAWSEILQPALRRYIEKFTQHRVWDYVSPCMRYVDITNPNDPQTMPEQHDPIAYSNAIYAGLTLHMLGLYEALYRDHRWDSDNSIVWAWSESEKYAYNHPRIAKIVHDQYMAHGFLSCTRATAFPMCNNHAVIGLDLFDKVHGERLDVKDKFFKFFEGTQLIDPESHEVSSEYYIPTNKSYHTYASMAMDGWTGLVMHVWKPAYIEAQYPFWIKHHVTFLPDGLLALDRTEWMPEADLPFLTAIAAEIGDEKTRDKAIATMDKICGHSLELATFHYQFKPSIGCMHSGESLAALASVLPKDGFLRMHANPFDSTHFQEPQVASFDFPKALLTRAVYDRSRGALVLGVRAGDQKNGTTTFTVRQLDPKSAWKIYINDRFTKEISGRPDVAIRVDLAQPQDVVLIRSQRENNASAYGRPATHADAAPAP